MPERSGSSRPIRSITYIVTSNPATAPVTTLVRSEKPTAIAPKPANISASGRGFTNGDGGFQTEVGFADLAIGVLGVLCSRFRDGFLLAAVIAVSIAYLGDAYGHLHQAAIHDNHAPDNTGLTLWADFIAPLVAIGLYALRRRAPGQAAKAPI
jgi:hypothetical protein